MKYDNGKYYKSRYGTASHDWEIGIDMNKLRTDRFAKAQKEVKDMGLGAILCFEPDNIRYLSSAYMLYGMRDVMNDYCFMPREGKVHLFDLASPAKRITCPWLEGNIEAPITLYHGALSSSTGLQDDFAKQIKKLMVHYGVENMPLGVDLGETAMIQALQKQGIEIVDGMEPMMRARIIKTPEEIDLIKRACTISEAAFDELARSIRPGLKENEIVGLCSKKMYDMGAETAVLIQTVTGPRGIPHSHCPSDRIIEPGDMVYVDCVSAYNGYRTCYYRCFSCGKPEQPMLEAYEKASLWLNNAINTVRPGITTKEVALGFPKAEEFGYKNEAEAFLQQYGHGIGLGQWERPIISRRFSLDHPQPIEKNMVFALETWCGSEDKSGAARIEEIIVVTDDGCELLTCYPSDRLYSCGTPGSDYFI